jgi:uncharacterized protein
MATHAPAGMAILDTDACYELLCTAEVGRLGVAVGHYPEIFPVNYVVEDGSIVFCTAEGTKLAATFAGQVVAFEIDGYEPDTDEAWSVMVKAHAEEIEMHDLLDDSAFDLHPWSTAPKPRFVRLIPDEISGRRFRVAQTRARHN